MKEKNTIKIDKKELEADIKSFMPIEEICRKYKIGRKTFYNKCKLFFNATPTEIRGDKLKHTNTMKITIDKSQLEKMILQEKSLEEMAKFFRVSKETVRRNIV
jgi:ASC-1-like (ASCH) protein